MRVTILAVDFVLFCMLQDQSISVILKSAGVCETCKPQQCKKSTNISELDFEFMHVLYQITFFLHLVRCVFSMILDAHSSSSIVSRRLGFIDIVHFVKESYNNNILLMYDFTILFGVSFCKHTF